jgi:exosortase/archaeosortase family protein
MSRPKAKDAAHRSAEGRTLHAYGPMAWFGLKFALLMGVYYGVVLLPFSDGLLYSYLKANARMTAAVLNFIGTTCQVSDVTIRSAQFGMSIRRGCDAIEPAWFFCAAVVSLQEPWAKKIPGMVVGAAIVLAANLVRLVSLFLLGIHEPKVFAVAHLELWPAAFILLAVFLFVGWIRWARRAPGADTHADP